MASIPDFKTTDNQACHHETSCKNSTNSLSINSSYHCFSLPGQFNVDGIARTLATIASLIVPVLMAAGLPV